MSKNARIPAVNAKVVNGSKSSKLARNGLNTGADFCEFMCTVIGDVLDGHIQPNVAGVAVRGASIILRVTELQLRHGKARRGSKAGLLIVGE